MGIRYYGYAFDADLVVDVMADPYVALSRDPLADAWGLIPLEVGYAATFEQRSPRRDLLYLDKAWRLFQVLTGPTEDRAARPSHRMFAGAVRHHAEGWEPWIRVVPPEQVPGIAEDFVRITDEEARRVFRMSARGGDPDEEERYGMSFMQPVRDFVSALADEGRGLIYEIG